jgi:uncharacterized membrane protein YcaP (DUF421 family)
MGIRTLIIYLMCVALIRVGSDKRILGRHSPFDMILAVIFGSVMSRAVNGAAPFFQTIFAGAVFILIHWCLSALSFRSRFLETVLKGKPQILIENGIIHRRALRATLISDSDLEEALYANGQVRRPAEVALARLECNGEISVIPAESNGGDRA